MTTWGFHPCWVVCFHAICRDTVHIQRDNRIVFNNLFFCVLEGGVVLLLLYLFQFYKMSLFTIDSLPLSPLELHIIV